MDETGQLEDDPMVDGTPATESAASETASSETTSLGAALAAHDQRELSKSKAHRKPLPRWAQVLVWTAGILVTAIGIQLATDIPGSTVFGALILGALIFRTGYFFLQQLATPVPPPPDPGTLRKVKITYRCSICSTEVRMTAATNEDPEPPRHCMEDMDIVAPVME